MMYDYDKDAFIAGYRAAFALRGWGTHGLRHVRQLRLIEPYTVEWHGENSVTVSWTVQDGEVQGLIVEPGLFPVTISGSVDGEQQGSFQWGVCTLDGSLPTVITTGAEREWYVNGIPDSTVITDPDPTNMGSVFCGDVYSTPGARMTLTVSWGGISLARIVTEAGEPLITEALPADVTDYLGGEWYPYSRYDGWYWDSAVVETGIAARLMYNASPGPNYFAWQTVNEEFALVLWSEDPAIIGRNVYAVEQLGSDGSIATIQTISGATQPYDAGNGIYWTWGIPPYYRPDNVKQWFTGGTGALIQFMQNVNPKYLITN